MGFFLLIHSVKIQGSCLSFLDIPSGSLSSLLFSACVFPSVSDLLTFTQRTDVTACGLPSTCSLGGRTPATAQCLHTLPQAGSCACLVAVVGSRLMVCYPWAFPEWEGLSSEGLWAQVAGGQESLDSLQGWFPSRPHSGAELWGPYAGVPIQSPRPPHVGARAHLRSPQETSVRSQSINMKRALKPQACQRPSADSKHQLHGTVATVSRHMKPSSERARRHTTQGSPQPTACCPLPTALHPCGLRQAFTTLFRCVTWALRGSHWDRAEPGWWATAWEVEAHQGFGVPAGMGGWEEAQTGTGGSSKLQCLLVMEEPGGWRDLDAHLPSPEALPGTPATTPLNRGKEASGEGRSRHLRGGTLTRLPTRCFRGDRNESQDRAPCGRGERPAVGVSALL